MLSIGKAWPITLSDDSLQLIQIPGRWFTTSLTVCPQNSRWLCQCHRGLWIAPPLMLEENTSLAHRENLSSGRFQWSLFLCLTLGDSMDCSPPGSSIHGIFQARVLEWVAISFSRGSSQPRDQTWVSHIVGRHFTIWATREVPGKRQGKLNMWSNPPFSSRLLQNDIWFCTGAEGPFSSLSTLPIYGSQSTY